VPSFVWNRDPQEAYENPYEYDANEQFMREAKRLLIRLYRLLYSDDHRYTRDERTTEKAVWLLQMDALDSLRDSLAALEKKHHRVAGKLFRTAIESMDLAAYFAQAGAEGRTHLEQWYDDDFVPHRVYRNFIGRTEGAEAEEQARRHYQNLSRFTHRTYRAIMDGYSLGGEDRLVHDAVAMLHGNYEESTTFLVLPHTMSAYFAVLANLILIFSDELARRGMVPAKEVQDAWKESLEVESVPRRFMTKEMLREQMLNTLNRET
jgi:hypothetical protein